MLKDLVPKIPLHFRQRLKRWLPWISLGMGVISAVLMNRSEEMAPRLLWIMSVGWLLGMLVIMGGALAQVGGEGGEAPALGKPLQKLGELRKNATFSLAERTLVQACLSQMLFFPLPSFVRSFGGGAGQVAFMVLLFAACAVVLVDVLFNWFYDHRGFFTLLLAFCLFVGLLYGLPLVTGFSLHTSLLLATAVSITTAWLPGLVAAHQQGRKLRAWVMGRAMALVAALGVVEFILAPAIPAVPWVLSVAAVADRVVQGVPQNVSSTFTRDAQRTLPISCFTSLRAPKSARETLFHVWLHHLEEVERIPVELSMDEQGAWVGSSTKDTLGTDPSGLWRCEARTTKDQRLGGVDFSVTVSRQPAVE